MNRDNQNGLLATVAALAVSATMEISGIAKNYEMLQREASYSVVERVLVVGINMSETAYKRARVGMIVVPGTIAGLAVYYLLKKLRSDSE